MHPHHAAMFRGDDDDHAKRMRDQYPHLTQSTFAFPPVDRRRHWQSTQAALLRLTLERSLQEDQSPIGTLLLPPLQELIAEYAEPSHHDCFLPILSPIVQFNANSTTPSSLSSSASASASASATSNSSASGFSSSDADFALSNSPPVGCLNTPLALQQSPTQSGRLEWLPYDDSRYASRPANCIVDSPWQYPQGGATCPFSVEEADTETTTGVTSSVPLSSSPFSPSTVAASRVLLAASRRVSKFGGARPFLRPGDRWPVCEEARHRTECRGEPMQFLFQLFLADLPDNEGARVQIDAGRGVGGQANESGRNASVPAPPTAAAASPVASSSASASVLSSSSGSLPFARQLLQVWSCRPSVKINSCHGSQQLIRIIDVEPAYAWEGDREAARQQHAEDEAAGAAACAGLLLHASAFKSPFLERVVIGWRRKPDFPAPMFYPGYGILPGAWYQREYEEVQRRVAAQEITEDEADVWYQLIARTLPQPVTGTKFLGFVSSPANDPAYEGKLETTTSGVAHCPRCSKAMSAYFGQIDGLTVPMQYDILPPHAAEETASISSAPHATGGSEQRDWLPTSTTTSSGVGAVASTPPTTAAASSSSLVHSTRRLPAAAAANLPLRVFNFQTGLSAFDSNHPRLPRGPMGYLMHCEDHRDCFSLQWCIYKSNSYSS